MEPRVVYMPGVWDMLHVGHVAILEKAKALGDILIVGVPSDTAVCEDKGRMPIIPGDQRCAMLKALKCVDKAVMYHKLNFVPALMKFKADVLVVGSTWGKDKRHIEATEYMKQTGGRVVQFEYTSGVSSTMIKERVVAQYFSIKEKEITDGLQKMS